ncbi:hypothetical protein [Stieleria varia]
MRFLNTLLLTIPLLCVGSLSQADPSVADDYFLTIGGGYAPSGNQVSLENNVLFFQRVLTDLGLDTSKSDCFFSDGDAKGHDVQVMDPQTIPKANRLMAEFFGNSRSLGLTYRDHRVPNVRASTRPDNIRKWFVDVGATMQSGDRLLVFVTAHGSRSSSSKEPYETTIATWGNSSIKMSEFVGLLDELPDGVDVVSIMVQCHAGGFSRLIFNAGDPDRGMSPQRRCGFFATVNDRPAAGCTPEVDEANYVEYSTYFWAALSGRTRMGESIELPDYDGNGSVSFDEAHAYTILTADTIDLPNKTSGEFLNQYSKFGKGDSELLKDDEPYSVILGFANPVQRAVLEGLSSQLNLEGEKRLLAASDAVDSGSGRGRFRRRREESDASRVRREISRDLERRWPELANIVNPVSIELMTTRSDEFIRAIEEHKDYKRYRELADAVLVDESKRQVKYERFLRVADNVALAENLRRMGNEERIRQFEAIVQAESGTLGDAGRTQ